MKKSVVIFSIFLFLAINMNTITTIAQPTQTFSEGFYSVEDLNLFPNVSYNVSNISPNRALMIVIDDNQVIQQALRFESNSKKYVLIPLQYGHRIVIIGNGQLSFTA